MKEIAGATESSEYKAALSELDTVSRDLDKVQPRVTATNALIDAGDIEGNALAAAYKRLGNDQALLDTLTSQRDALNAKVDAARAACEGLYHTEELIALIESGAADYDTRLRLKAQIALRIKRIDIDFEPKQKDGVRYTEAVIRFVNGYVGRILFVD